MMIKMDISGWKEVEKLFEEIPKRARGVMRQAGNLFISELKRGTTWMRRSAAKGWIKTDDYKLKESFSLRSVSYNELQITSQVPYASIRDTGGVIPAKNKPYLVFDRPGGGLIKVKSVTQQGIGYIGKAELRATPRIVKLFQDAIEAAGK